MFRKKNTPSTASSRPRKPAGTLSESFRRNNVVLSRRQQEIAQRQQSVSQRQAEKKQRLVRRRLKVRIICLLVAALVTFALYRSSISNVAVVSNASTRLQKEQALVYEGAVLQAYQANTILGQPGLADSGAAAEALKNEYPEIERISFSTRPFSPVLKTDIRFRKPVFTWHDASGEQQFVDQNGVLFSKNLDPAANTDKLIAIEDQSGVVLEAGSSVLTENLIQFVGQLHGKVPALYGPNSRVERVIIPRSTREVQLQVSGLPYRIKFNSARDLEQQVGELGTLLKYLSANNITPSEYIDLRVEHKAFYR